MPETGALVAAIQFKAFCSEETKTVETMSHGAAYTTVQLSLRAPAERKREQIPQGNEDGINSGHLGRTKVSSSIHQHNAGLCLKSACL